MAALDTSAVSVSLAFSGATTVTEQGEGCIVMRSGRGEVPLRGASPEVVAALRRLCGGATEESLVRCVVERDGESALPLFFYYLDVLTEQGMVSRTIRSAGDDLATIIPCRPRPRLAPASLVADGCYLLSRFALLRRTDEGVILESPLSDVRITLHDRRMALLLHSLAAPSRVAELTEKCPDLSCEAIELLLATLLSSRIIVESDDAERHLAQWSFHDLLLHSRSRRGRYDGPYGATFRFLGACDPLTAVKLPMSTDAIDLHRPDIAVLSQSDLPFTRVIEERRSIRRQGESPITLEQLGEFLYRVARVRSIEDEGSVPYQRSSRPYPSAGACHELEIYPIVTACAGLASGVYHYDPLEHRLYGIAEPTAGVERLVQEADHASGQHGRPQVLLVIAARFGRVAWKYDAIAYALTLKNVGALFQTMYLVATAMNLAGCAIGGGDADRFAGITGLDYYAESSVGEFMLGSRGDLPTQDLP